MRRALLAVTGLAASTTALVVLKGSPGASQVAQDVPAAPAAATPGEPAPDGTPDPSVAPSAGASPSAKPSAGASRTPSGTRSTTAAPRATTAAPRTTTAAPPKTTTRTVLGPEISYEYGTATVQITVSGSKIVNATGYLPDGGQSGLRSSKVNAAYSGSSGQVVKRQSADLDTVSGATATSDAYQQSLQAAIDRAF